MKHILKTISLIFCISLIILISSCRKPEQTTNKYTVTFKDYDETILKQEVVEEGHSATAPKDPEREGYNFIGWDKEYINVTKDTSIIALYEKIEKPVVMEYTVTFVDYNGTVLKKEIVQEGQNVNPPTNPIKEGYKFDGLYLDNEKWSSIGYSVTDNIELVAKWSIITYKITLKYINSLEPNDNVIEFTIEDSEVNIKEPTKIGYNFLGLYLDEELTIPYKKFEYKDFDLYAKFEPITYTVTFDSYYGENVDRIKFTILSETILLPEAKRVGFTFLGWYDEENNKITEIKCGTYKDIHLVAKYEKITTDEYELSSDKTYYIVTGIGKTTDTKIVIPSTYSGLPVTSIGDSAFYNCTSLESIEIPNSITSIGSFAFAYCTSLTSIEIPNSVTSIGENAFRQCARLESIEIPNSVTSIGEYAFVVCRSLENVYYNGTIEDWCKISFSDDSSNPMYYAEHIYMLNENNEYYEVKEIVIPETVTAIGSYQFYGFDNLISIEIPNSVTSIGDWAFYGCTCLESIEIPNSVTSIEDLAFYNCTRLTSIEIPNSVISIGDCAFTGCTRLTSIEIPNSVTRIGSDAFRGCTNLESIIVDNGNNIYDSRDNCNGIIEKNTNSLIVGCKNTIIPDSVTSIGYSAFEDCTSLTSIEIPNSVRSIGSDAFRGCTSLTSIEIPNSVRSIGLDAFNGCTSLTSIEIPNSVTTMGNYAFRGCTSLTIYCEATSKPEGWSSNWNFSNCPVVWGYVEE